MVLLRFRVAHQKLSGGRYHPVSGTYNYIEADFDFTDDWEGLTKWLHISKGEEAFDIALDSENRAFLDLGSGTWEIKLHGDGYDSDGTVIKRITTENSFITVDDYGSDEEGSVFLEEAPDDLESSITAIAERALSAAEEAGTAAAEAKTAAEEAKALCAEAVLPEGAVQEAVNAYFEENPPETEGFEELLKNVHLSVLSFGAKGDGVTDDTEALRAAAASGESVFFPKGVYLLCGQIDQTADISWFGEGEGSIIKLMPYDQSRPEDYNEKTVYNCYMISQADGIGAKLSLRDMVFDANKEAYVNDVLGNGSSKYDHTVCVDLYKPAGVYLHNVKIRNALIEGAYIYNGDDCEVIISDCCFNENGYDDEDASGLHIEGSNYHTVITNCEFCDNGFNGLLLGGARGATVTGITCAGNKHDGLMLWGGASHNVISGVMAYNNRGGVHLKGSYSAYYIDRAENKYAEGNVISSLVTKYNQYGVIFGNSRDTRINGWVSNNDDYNYLIANYEEAPEEITGSIIDPVFENSSGNEYFISTGNPAPFKVKVLRAAEELYIPGDAVYITPEIEIGRLSLGDGGIRDDVTDQIRTKDFIACTEGIYYTFSTNGRHWCLLFYDENQEFLTGWTEEGKSYLYLKDSGYTAPEGAAYMKLLCDDGEGTDGEVVISYIPKE